MEKGKPVIGNLYVDLSRPSSKVSNITHAAEKAYQSYTANRPGRTLFINIEEIRKHDIKLAEKFEEIKEP